MKAGLPISLLLHAVVIAGATLSFSSVEPMEDAQVVPVELLTIDEFTDIRASIERERPSPEEAEPMQVETSIENAPEVGDRVNVAPDEQSDAAVIPPPPEPEESEEVTEEPEQVAEAQPDFDLDRISGLIDRSQDTAPVADSQIADEAEEQRLAFSDRDREGVGTGTRMTVSELDALNSAMYRCWRKPIDATDLEKLIVRLQVEMLPGGYVESVEVIDRGASRARAPGNPYWDIAEMRAVQAVSKCAPYDFLPQEKFDQWQSLILNFRPQL